MLYIWQPWHLLASFGWGDTTLNFRTPWLTLWQTVVINERGQGPQCVCARVVLCLPLFQSDSEEGGRRLIDLREKVHPYVKTNTLLFWLKSLLSRPMTQFSSESTKTYQNIFQMFSISKERLIWLCQCAALFPLSYWHWSERFDRSNLQLGRHAIPITRHLGLLRDWVRGFQSTISSVGSLHYVILSGILFVRSWICVNYSTFFYRWVKTMTLLWQSRMRSETASIPNGNKWMNGPLPLAVSFVEKGRQAFWAAHTYPNFQNLHPMFGTEIKTFCVLHQKPFKK